MRGYFFKRLRNDDGETHSNRGAPRIWLQGEEVSTAGMEPGMRFDVHVKGGTVVLRADPNGSRVVSRKIKKDEVLPVIDINSKELLALFDGMSAIRLVQREGEIHLLPLATELRKKERVDRLRRKMAAGEPLEIGSMSHGGGVLSHAIHAGLAAGGIPSKLGFANDIRPELLDHARKHNSAWSPDTVPLAAPMQELAFDSKAMDKLGRKEIVEAGWPCSGASVAGRARRGTAHPEEHPEVGHLVVAGLMIMAKANPAIFMLENVVPYASSASASILRSQLRDLGYKTHETILDGAEFNALEPRKRWCLVAVTEGIHFDWSMLQKPIKRDIPLSEALDPIPEDHPAWSEMRGLKEKEKRDKEAGKGFMMQVFKESDTQVATITKGYAKVRSTDPKLAHPTNPDLLRQFTPAEHARIKQVPPELIDGLSATIAHELLGQGIVYEPFKATGKLLADTIHHFVSDLEHKPKNVQELIEAMSAEVASSAEMVVSELRKPLMGVVYEGPITVNDLGMAIQDVGNGVGILHKADALQQVRLGEILRVQYPSARAVPKVTHLSEQAPAITESLRAAVAVEEAQMSLLDTSPEPMYQPSRGPRMG